MPQKDADASEVDDGQGALGVVSITHMKSMILLAVLAALVFGCLDSMTMDVEPGVRPYVEKCLDLLIEKNHEAIYESYLQARALSLEEFGRRMDYFSEVFDAEPESFSYLRSYVGGEGYFIQYSLVLSDGRAHSCTFGFPAKGEAGIRVQDLESMSVSADEGEKSFEVDFTSGNVFACRAPEGCYGEARPG
jgi:hypothetical protein